MTPSDPRDATITTQPSVMLRDPPKNVPWSLDENDILLKRVSENTDSRGRPRWAYVAKGLPGRTAQEARCRYRRITDAQVRKARGERFRNICHACGQPRRGHVCPGIRVSAQAREETRVKFQEPEWELGALTAEAAASVSEDEPSQAPADDEISPAEEADDASDSEEEYPSLPVDCQAISKAPSVMPFPSDSLNDLVSGWWNATGNPLKRFNSMGAYIDAFYDHQDELKDADAGPLLANDLLGFSALEQPLEVC